MFLPLFAILVALPSWSFQLVNEKLKCCPKHQILRADKDGNFTCLESGEKNVPMDEIEICLLEYFEKCSNLCLEKFEPDNSLVVLNCQRRFHGNYRFCSLKYVYEYIISKNMEFANKTILLETEETLTESYTNDSLIVNNVKVSFSQFCLELKANASDKVFDYSTQKFDARLEDHFVKQKECISQDALHYFEVYIGKATSKQMFAYDLLIYSKSTVGLLLTALGYLILPEMKNILGKLVTIYCFIFGLAYIIMFWGAAFSNLIFCNIRAFLFQFLMLASFSWASLISYEMWKVLGKPCRQIHNNSTEHKNWKRFLIYNLLVWSFSTFWVSLALAVWMYNIFPQYFPITITKYECIINKVGSYSFYVFFYLPAGILAFVNAIFYIMIVRYFTKVKFELNKMADNVKEERCSKSCVTIEKNVFTFVKLGVVMGVLRLFKVLVGTINYKLDFSLTWFDEIINYTLHLQGIFTFSIFMVKKKVLESIRNKIYRK